ncbi:hypothetical protein J7L13_00210 [bacterium]|nr:hypothetical protein [bacterium]
MRILIEIGRNTPYNRNDVINAVIYYTNVNEIREKNQLFTKSCLKKRPDPHCGRGITLLQILYTGKVLDKLKINNLDRHITVNSLLMYTDTVTLLRYTRRFNKEITNIYPDIITLLEECGLKYDLKTKYYLFDYGLDYLDMVGCLK